MGTLDAYVSVDAISINFLAAALDRQEQRSEEVK